MDKSNDIKALIKGDKAFTFNGCKTTLVGNHVSFIIAIGDNHSATLTMTDEAYEELMIGAPCSSNRR